MQNSIERKISAKLSMAYQKKKKKKKPGIMNAGWLYSFVPKRKWKKGIIILKNASHHTK